MKKILILMLVLIFIFSITSFVSAQKIFNDDACQNLLYGIDSYQTAFFASPSVKNGFATAMDMGSIQVAADLATVYDAVCR